MVDRDTLYEVYYEGYSAVNMGLLETDCEYVEDTPEYYAWMTGYYDHYDWQINSDMGYNPEYSRKANDFADLAGMDLP